MGITAATGIVPAAVLLQAPRAAAAGSSSIHWPSAQSRSVVHLLRLQPPQVVPPTHEH